MSTSFDHGPAGVRANCDQFRALISTRPGGKTFVIFDFLVSENLDAARVDQIQMPDLISCRSGVARNQSFATRKSCKPS